MASSGTIGTTVSIEFIKVILQTHQKGNKY